MEFQYNCVNPKSLTELEYIIDKAQEIKHDTFKKRIGIKNFNKLQAQLGYDRLDFKLKDDWAVSFHRSKLPNKRPVYYLRWSAIEYVFY